MKPLPENILKHMRPEDRQPLGKAGMTMDEANEIAEIRSEKELQKLIANHLRQKEIPFFQSRMDKKNSGTIGWPDFTFPFKGNFVAVEVKIGAKHPTPEQTRCLRSIELNGGLIYVVRSFEQFLQVLK